MASEVTTWSGVPIMGDEALTFAPVKEIGQELGKIRSYLGLTGGNEQLHHGHVSLKDGQVEGSGFLVGGIKIDLCTLF